MGKHRNVRIIANAKSSQALKLSDALSIDPLTLYNQYKMWPERGCQSNEGGVELPYCWFPNQFANNSHGNRLPRKRQKFAFHNAMNTDSQPRKSICG
jgi:hypothetical protein